MTVGLLLLVAALFPLPRGASGPAAAPATPVSPDSSPAFLDRCDAAVLEALEVFARTGKTADARRAVARAQAARDLLEAAEVPAPLADARAEKLIFFNHVIPGLSAYLQSPRGPADREALASILRRGRAHRERGQAALRAAALHAPGNGTRH